VFYELLQGGNISVKITSNENSDVPDTYYSEKDLSGY
jgi:hypothetical protein